MLRVLLIGSTGLVGGHVLKRLLADARIAQVVAPTRRPLDPHPRLFNPIIDFEDLPRDAPWWAVDAAISTLGTTLKQAGSQDAFRRIDLGYTLDVARLVHERGTQRFALNSALGANAGSSSFYLRTKGEIERDIAALAFASLTIVRPGLLGGKRDHPRLVESIGLVVAGTLGRLLPAKWRISDPERVAAALVDGVVAGLPGSRIVSSADLS